MRQEEAISEGLKVEGVSWHKCIWLKEKNMGIFFPFISNNEDGHLVPLLELGLPVSFDLAKGLQNTLKVFLYCCLPALATETPQMVWRSSGYPLGGEMSCASQPSSQTFTYDILVPPKALPAGHVVESPSRHTGSWEIMNVSYQPLFSRQG